MMAPVTLTESTSVAEFGELLDCRIVVTTPRGRQVSGIPSWIDHRDAGGLRITWSDDNGDWPSIVPYGSVAVHDAGGPR